MDYLGGSKCLRPIGIGFLLVLIQWRSLRLRISHSVANFCLDQRSYSQWSYGASWSSSSRTQPHPQPKHFLSLSEPVWSICGGRGYDVWHSREISYLPQSIMLIKYHLPGLGISIEISVLFLEPNVDII